MGAQESALINVDCETGTWSWYTGSTMANKKAVEAQPRSGTRASTVERIPWSGPEPGNPSYQKPRWRLMCWRVVEGVPVSLDEVVECNFAWDLMVRCGWPDVPSTETIRAAIGSLGPKNVDGTQATCQRGPDPHWRLTIDADGIQATDRETGTRMRWVGRGWVTVPV